MWNSTDYSFKKNLGKRVTSSIKKYYEEFGDVTVDIHASEVKYSTIPFNDPAAAVTAGVAEARTLFVLTLDNSVANNQAWFAASGPTRLKNWLSDKYGDNFTIKLYDNANNQIFPTDGSDWIFDYTTGVLMFNGNANAFPQPFKITGYRYTGQYLSDVTPGGDGGHVIQSNGISLPQRAKLNFAGAVFQLSDDSFNDATIVTLAAITAPGVSYTPTTPSDWSFTTVPINAQQALDSIAAYLALTAPAKAPALTGVTLTFAGQTLYSAKLAGGLPAAWYTLFPAGTTVNNVIYGPTFTLTALGFRAGSANTPATYGSIIANVNSVDVNTYNMSGGPGSAGIIQALNFQVHNSIWEKADGRINANQTAEGAATYIMKHTEAGQSNPFSVHRDDSASAVTFPVGVVMSIQTLIAKWLSGVSYLGQGTVLNISFTIQNVFRKVYMPSGVAVLSAPAIPATNFDPISIPNFTDNFAVSSTVTLSIPNIANLAPVATVTARKPNNLSAAVSNFNLATISNGISTYGTVSTATEEFFQDEARRLNVAGLTPFDSAATLSNDECKVVPGALTFNPFGNVNQNFVRRFTKATANNGNIQVGGMTNIADVAPFGTGSMNILLHLETENLWFDLGRPFGSNNGSGDGSSPANSIGARTSFSAGNFGYSFGTYSTANNGNQYKLQVIKRTGSPNLTQITTT